MSYIGRSSDGFGLLNKYRWVASGGETSIASTLTDSNGKQLRFTDKNLVVLFKNGTKLDQTAYNLNTANTISGLTALSASDILEAHVYDTFSIATFDTVPTSGGTFTGDVMFGDSIYAKFGASADLKIGHHNSQSYIENYGGHLNIWQLADAKDINLYSDSGTGGTAKYIMLDGGDGEVRLFHAASGSSSVKLTTKATGVDITGVLTTDGATHDGDVTFTGDSYNVTWDKSDNALEFPTGAKATFGSNFEIVTYSNGNTAINQSDDHLYIQIQGNDHSFYIYADDGTSSSANSKYFEANGTNGEVTLHHYGSEKLATKSTGIDVTGIAVTDGVTSSGTVDITGTNKLQLGDDGTYIHQSADGVLDLVADVELELNGALVDINSTAGNVELTAVGGNVEITGDTGNMTFTNSGTGDISLGNFKFDSDQTVGSGQDNYVLTYDHSTTKISLEAASGGGGSLSGLSDVTIASVANNDLIKYNSTAGEWQNTNLGLTVTPTVSVTSGDYYNDADSITISVTNHSSYDLPAYSVEVRRQDNNNLILNMDSISGNTEAIDITTDELTPEGRPTGEIIINTGQSASNFDTITTDNFKILVLAQDFGDLQSEVATLNVSVVARPQVSFDGSTAYRYWRLADFDNQIYLTNWKAYSAINQGGTAYPDTEAISTGAHPTDEHIQSWTSDGQTNVAKSNFAYSTTYSTADPFNDGTQQGYWTISDTNSSYWSTDNGFSAPSAYEDEQILLVWDMGTARTIKSMKFIFADQYTNTVASGDNAFIIQGSNDESSWTTVCTVQASDQDFAAASGSTTVLVSDTS